MNKNVSTRSLVRCAVVAALYAVLCFVLAPFSYGPVQVRVAEALCLLPVLGPEYIVGVTLGCFLANLIGSTVIDVVFGTAATLIACILTYMLRKRRWAGLALPGAIPPIVSNALIVGAFVITFYFAEPGTTATFAAAAFNAVTVGLGEVISCGILGVTLIKLIESNAALRRIFCEDTAKTV